MTADAIQGRLQSSFSRSWSFFFRGFGGIPHEPWCSPDYWKSQCGGPVIADVRSVFLFYII